MLSDLINIFPLEMMNKAQEVLDGSCSRDITLEIQCCSTKDITAASPQSINKRRLGLQ